MAEFTLIDAQFDGDVGDDYYYGVWGDGDYIYCTCYSGGVRAYTFNGSTFTLAGSKDDGDDYYEVWGDGTYIYCACGGSGVRAYTFNGSTFTLAGSKDDGKSLYF